MKTQNVSAYKHATEGATEKEKKNPRRYGDEKGF